MGFKDDINTSINTNSLLENNDQEKVEKKRFSTSILEEGYIPALEYEPVFDDDPYCKYSEAYPDDWERIIQRKSSEELEYDKKRLEKELILKCWIIDNPEKAKIWFTHYRHSRSNGLRAYYLKYFIRVLGTDDVKDTSLLLDKYRSRRSKENSCNKYFDGVYFHWKTWIEELEEYREFKNKLPREWQKFVWSINAEEVMKTIGYDGCRMDEIIDYNYCRELGTYRAYELLKKWSSDNKSLWEDIILTYKAEEKDEDTYLIQAWLDHFERDNDFEVWKVVNPDLWRELKQWDDGKLYQVMADLNKHNFEGRLFALWIKENENSWDIWKGKNQKYWGKCFESHKTLLWYIYIESKWFIHQSHTILEKNTNYAVLHAAFYLRDPRKGYLDDEIKMHKELIEKYHHELKRNPKKRHFVETYCSEKEKDQFFRTYYEQHAKEEEEPNTYADRKLRELWIEKHQKQWNLWKRKLMWKKYYRNQVRYKLSDYFKVWKRIHRRKWNLWVEKEFPTYKEMVKNVEIWYSWLSDKDNAVSFDNWANNNIEDWEKRKRLFRFLDCKYICESYGITIEDYYDWKNRKTKEWDFIEERLYIELFKKADIPRAYTSEFRLKLKIEELKYLASCGKSIFHDHLAIIEHNEKLGYINEQGDIVIEIQYDKATDFKKGIAAVKIEEFEAEEYFAEIEDWLDIKYGGRWGIIDGSGKYLRQPQYDNLEFVNDDIILFRIEGKLDLEKHCFVDSKWGIMNYEMEIIVPAKFSYLALAKNGLIRARIEDDSNSPKWGLMTTEGKVICPFKYSYIYDSSTAYMLATINSTSETCEEDLWHDSQWGNGLEQWGYIDINGNEIAPFELAYDEADFKKRHPMITDEENEADEYEDEYYEEYDDDLYTVTSEDSHFSRYFGSYAQDEMRYSDEDIDTIFDGDPSAYWNID